MRASTNPTLTFAAMLAAASLAFATPPVHAQFSGNTAYDINSHAYFVTGNATLSGDAGNNDILVGKNNATDFKTQPGSVTLSVVNGGKDYYAASYQYPDGKYYYGLNVFGGHAANVSGGSVRYATGYDTSTVTIGNATVAGTADSYNSGTLNITGGTVPNTYSYDTSTVNISGGSVTRSDFYNSSTVNVTGGNSNQVYAHDTSTANISGGVVTFAYGYVTGAVNITGGTVNNAVGYNTGVINISGGTVTNANANQSSIINISGGTVTNASGQSDGLFNITGGNIAEIYAESSSVFNLRGGTISASTIFNRSSNARINFFGLGVAYTNPTAGTDPNYFNVAGVYYDVAWTRPDGTTVKTRYFDNSGSTANAAPRGATFTFQTAAVVPEDGTLALVLTALGAVGAVAVRRRG